jgi:Na+-translocating ferredoxin:NAD+ oxidoreductase RnfD subunit
MPGELIPIVLFICVPVIIKIVSDNSIRKMLIEKGMLDENVKYLYANSFDRKVPPALKWGMVSIAVGLAVFISEVFYPGMASEIMVSLMLIFGGLALILYYFIAKKMAKDD